MVTIKLLDKTLNFIKGKGTYGLTEEDNPAFTDEENEYLHEAVRHLEKDGYVYMIRRPEYRLSINGLLALQETYWLLFRNKPYKRQRFQRRVERVWLAVKIICVVLNALAIIVLGILALFKD
jgi:hypothetical protein